jgi:hypothetical protein
MTRGELFKYLNFDFNAAPSIDHMDEEKTRMTDRMDCMCVCVCVSLPVSLPNAYIRTGVHEQERLLALKLKNNKKC